MKWAIIVGSLLVVIVGVFVFSVVNDNSNPSGFASCLTESGAKFYGASWCGHCSEQKKAFGDDFKDIHYVECAAGSGQAEACKDAEIRAYPTWVFDDGSKIEGKLSMEKLAQKTGCSL